MTSCPDAVSAANPATEEALRLIDFSRSLPAGNILVGMGNNFTPEFNSRFVRTRDGHILGKDRFVWDFKKDAWVLNDEADDVNEDLKKGLGRIPVDNVACFFSRAGYSALVPGKHDFYFGAEYVRYLARLLASIPPSPSVSSPVQMLAANLVIQTTVDDALPRIPSNEAHNPWYNSTSDDFKFSIKDRDTLLPYSLRFQLLTHPPFDSSVDDGVPVTTPFQIWICKAINHNPDDIGGLFRDKCQRLQPSWADNRNAKTNQSTSPLAYRFTPSTYQGKTLFLQAGSPYLLCAFDPRNAEKARPSEAQPARPYCVHFNVASPFFMFPHSVPRVDSDDGVYDTDGRRVSSEYKNPNPYVITSRSGPNRDSIPVAIFGVLDQNITQSIGRLNYSWISDDNRERFSTQISAINPAEALRELMEYFDEQHPDFTGDKILLAQMSAGKARALARSMAGMMKGRFSLIIADPETEDPTPDESRTVSVDPDPATDQMQEGRGKGEVQYTQPTFVVVPSVFYHQDFRLPKHLAVGSANVQKTQPCDHKDPSCQEKWALDIATHHYVFDHFNKALEDLKHLRVDVDSGLQQFGLREPPGNLKDDLTQLALLVMREGKQADLAFLQKRDVFLTKLKFDDETELAGKLQEVLDRIFWKGDFAIRIPVTGATLRAVMKESQSFDDAESALPRQEVDEPGRGLVTLGIRKDSAGTWFVNGAPLDDGKIYIAAVSDYIGMGDTGYPELLIPPVGHLPKLADIGELRPISAMLCHAINSPLSGSYYEASECQDDTLPTDNYFDELTLSPFDTTAGFTPVRQTVAWLKFWNHPLKPWAASNPGKENSRNAVNASAPAPIKTSESITQNRPITSYSLNKLALNFNLNQHNNGTEKEVSDLFSGIPIPQLTSPNSNAIGVDFAQRIDRDYRWADAYGQVEASLARALTRQSDVNNTDLPNIQKDLLAFEGGGLPRIGGDRTDRLRPLTSLRVETQIVDPQTMVRLKTAGQFLVIKSHRTKNLLPKFGLRFANPKSWIEGGYTPGYVYSTPVNYILNPGSKLPFSCPVAASTSLATCISSVGAAITPTTPYVVDYRNHFQHGLFMNFHLDIKLPIESQITYTMDSQGIVYFNRGNDLSVDTKFQEDWIHTLSVPIWGNFSLTPTFELFFYENKVSYNYFKSFRTTIGVQYKFDWHSGVGWKNAMIYRSPPPGK